MVDGAQYIDMTGIATEVAYQNRLLPQVSRSFALTIPQLPDYLGLVVGNAYLLCRIAVTIEDEPNIPAAKTRELHELFIQVTRGEARPEAFAEKAAVLLTDATKPAERELVENTASFIRVTRALPRTARESLQHCVYKMCLGMPDYQAMPSCGLPALEDFNRYCYTVAGVVGEMLTELFCDYAPDIGAQRDKMEELGASFGQGLQMTNILKDIWDDLDRGFCWLPRSLFEAHAYNLDELSPTANRDVFNACEAELLGLAHGHLTNALDYTLCIPSRHHGIRVFCLWAIGLALPTLQRIYRTPAYSSGQDVKISRRRALFIIRLISFSARSNTAQRLIFRGLGLGLPYTPVNGVEYAKFVDGILPGRTQGAIAESAA